MRHNTGQLGKPMYTVFQEAPTEFKFKNVLNFGVQREISCFSTEAK